MLDSADLLRMKLEAKKKQQEQNKELQVVSSPKIILIKKEHILEELKYIDEFDESDSVKEVLKNKALELVSLNINSQLELGKILEELYEELGRKGSKEGTYYKFLDLVGYNKMTALRYRKKYDLFKQAIGENSRIAISKLTFRQIEILYKNPEDIKSIIELLEEGKEIKEAIGLLPDKSKDEEVFPEINKGIFDIKDKFKIFSKEIEKKNISNEKIEKISELMKEIEELLMNN